MANEAPVMLDITASARTEHRSTTVAERLNEYPARWWNRVVFCVVAAGWTPLSLVAWLAMAIAVFGWQGDGTFDSPSIVAEPTSAGVLTIVMATLIFTIGSVVLGSLARWSIPGRRWISWTVAVIAIAWAPVAATAWSLAG